MHANSTPLRLAGRKDLNPELWHLIDLGQLDDLDRRIAKRRSSPRGVVDKAKNTAEAFLGLLGIKPVQPITDPAEYRPTEADIAAYEVEGPPDLSVDDLSSHPRLAAIYQAVCARELKASAEQLNVPEGQVLSVFTPPIQN